MGPKQVCEIRFGAGEGIAKPWVVEAKWSPDGRYLAALTTLGEPVVEMIDLALLDMTTGELRHFDFGYQYLFTLTWHPDSQMVMVAAEIDSDERGSIQAFYVVDAGTGISKPVPVSQDLIGAGFWGLAWSPNAQDIAFACPTIMSTKPTIEEGRLCVISAEKIQ